MVFNILEDFLRFIQVSVSEHICVLSGQSEVRAVGNRFSDLGRGGGEQEKCSNNTDKAGLIVSF
jgi:hypothetical protein